MREAIVRVECDNCGEQFFEREEGSNRVVIHLKKGVFESDLCDVCYSVIFVFEIREVRRPDAEHQCDSCGKSFGSPGGLKNHITRKHS